MPASFLLLYGWALCPPFFYPANPIRSTAELFCASLPAIKAPIFGPQKPRFVPRENIG